MDIVIDAVVDIVAVAREEVAERELLGFALNSPLMLVQVTTLFENKVRYRKYL